MEHMRLAGPAASESMLQGWSPQKCCCEHRVGAGVVAISSSVLARAPGSTCMHLALHKMPPYLQPTSASQQAAVQLSIECYLSSRLLGASASAWLQQLAA